MPDRWVNPEGWGPSPSPGSRPPSQGTTNLTAGSGLGSTARTKARLATPTPAADRMGIASTPRPVIERSMVAPLARHPGSPAGPLGRRRLERRQPIPYQRPRPGNASADHQLLPAHPGHHVDGPTNHDRAGQRPQAGRHAADAGQGQPGRPRADRQGHLKATARYPAGTVIAQSRKAGADVLPDTTVSLVVAKAPPPPHRPRRRRRPRPAPTGLPSLLP